MKNHQYTAPELQVFDLSFELLLSESNQVTNDGTVHLNPNTMRDGDGSDAVKARNYSVWEEDWNQ